MTFNFQPIVQVMSTTLDWRDRSIAELEAQLQQANAENAALKEQIARLQRQIAELERSGKRQATPFSRQERKANPKRPGRKAGQGRFSHRANPGYSPGQKKWTRRKRSRCAVAPTVVGL